MTHPHQETILRAFDAQFGTDGPEANSDSIGRSAGCDDCSANIELRAEHRAFVEKVVRGLLNGAVYQGTITSL